MILQGKSAKIFIKEAERNLKNRGSIDFSKQGESAKKILQKAKNLTP